MGKSFYDKDISKRIFREWNNGSSIKELQYKYQYKTSKSIIDKLKKEGVNSDEIKNDRYKKDWVLSFSSLSPFTSYLLGLIATDGYITNKDRVGIDLTDEDCIAFISAKTGKPYQSYDKTKYKTENNILTKKLVHRIIFNGKDLVKQLEYRGITERKSKTIGKIFFKESEKQFIPYFIRGVMDGDGTIGFTSGNTLYFSIISYSKNFLLFLEECLVELGMTDLHFYKDHCGWDLYSAKKENIDILRKIYKVPFGMERKRSKLFIDRRSETIIKE